MQPSATNGTAESSPTTLTPTQQAIVAASIARLRDLPGALLPILHDIQEQLGFVPPAAVPVVADALNLSHAEVHGVVSFYHDFRSAPPGHHVLKVCRAEACQAVGSERLEQHLQAVYGAAPGATTACGKLTVEPVYCLGNCALGPSVQWDGDVVGRVDEGALDELLASARVVAQRANGCGCGRQGGCS
jgi:formate dehydrogenase subunit gamma